MPYELKTVLSDKDLVELAACGTVTPEVLAKLQRAAAVSIEKKIETEEDLRRANQRFEFTVEATDVMVLNASQIWPDWDSPQEPTVADVKNQFDKYSSHDEVVADWNLDKDVMWRIKVKKL